MRPFLAFIVTSFIVTATAWSIPLMPSALKTKERGKQTTKRRFLSSRFDKFIHKLFNEADTNHNGEIDVTETYELVLRMYVQLNRQAPIPPPTRAAVLQLYREADMNHNGLINQQEFTRLACLLGERALARLVVHKLVSLVGAPLLAEWVIRQCHGLPWIQGFATRIVPKKWVPMVTSPAFGRTLLVVLFVASLGNIVMSIVNWMMDVNLPMEEEVKMDNKV